MNTDQVFKPEESPASHRQGVLLLILIALIVAAGYFFWQQVTERAVVVETPIVEEREEKSFDYSTLPSNVLTVAFCEFAYEEPLDLSPDRVPEFLVESDTITFTNFGPSTFYLEFSFDPGFLFTVPSGESQTVQFPENVTEFDVRCDGMELVTLRQG